MCIHMAAALLSTVQAKRVIPFTALSLSATLYARVILLTKLSRVNYAHSDKANLPSNGANGKYFLKAPPPLPSGLEDVA